MNSFLAGLLALNGIGLTGLAVAVLNLLLITVAV